MYYSHLQSNHIQLLIYTQNCIVYYMSELSYETSSLPAPKFNVAKYAILSAISTLRYNKLPATSFSISFITGQKQETVQHNLMRYDPYLIQTIAKKSPDKCRIKYNLSTQGRRCLGRFLARHDNGFDLKLKSNHPFKCDYSKVRILVQNLDERLDILKKLYGA